MNTLPHNFLGLEERYGRFEDARFAVLPVPYDATTSYQPGARLGPQAIIRASQHVELFDEEMELECHKCGIATLDAVEPNLGSPEAMHQDLFKLARGVVRRGKFLFALGGDHSISSALVRAAMLGRKKLSVLHIDAHCDMRESYQGSRYSHASVMCRVVEAGAAVVSVGVRTFSAEDRRFVKKNGIPVITARNCHMDDDWVDRVLNALGDDVYVTVDIDAFDPSFAPGTGAPEPGGLDWYQVTGLLRLVAAEKNVMGADVVEVAPIPGQVVTEFLAARLAYKLMGYVQTRG